MNSDSCRAFRRVAEFLRRLGANGVFTHQFGDGIDAARDPAALDQFLVDTWAAIALFDLGMDGLDLHQQGVAALLLLAGGSRTPGVVALSRDAEGAAHDGDGPIVLVLVDEGEDHSTSLAKKAVAFFKMSHSIWSRLFSALS